MKQVNLEKIHKGVEDLKAYFQTHNFTPQEVLFFLIELGFQMYADNVASTLEQLEKQEENKNDTKKT